MTGNSLIGNTSQFMIDATGKRVILDLEHCVCCDQTVEGLCGECVNEIGNAITVDLGVTGFAGGSSYCDTACENLTGEIVLTRVLPCSWRYFDGEFCERAEGGGFYSLQIDANIFYYTATAEWSWSVTIYITSPVRPPLGGGESTIQYIFSTGTTCAGTTTTLTKQFQLISGATLYPCEVPVTWPATIDVITP